MKRRHLSPLAPITVRRPRFADDERGVSEAVGYLITFGISTVVLVTTMQAFIVIRDYTTDLAVERALEDVAAQVAFAVEEAMRAATDYPDADFSMTVTIPRNVQGVDYFIELNQERVLLTASNADVAATGGGGQELDTRGRVSLNYVQRAGIGVHCADGTTVITGGTCRVHSEMGEFLVVYDEPGSPAGRGVYFKVR